MKKLWKQLSGIFVCLAAIILSGCSLFGGEVEIKTYTVSGYIYADGVALEGASVDCGGRIVTTDADGYYECAGLDRAVQVVASKSGIYFSDDLVYVYEDSTEVNFSGYAIFDVSGVTRNGAQVVPYARVESNSILGKYETISNEFGVFYLPNLAGEVEVNAYKDGITFFSQTFGRGINEVIVNSQTRVTGRIVADDDYSVDDFTITLDGRECVIEDDGSFNISGVSVGSSIALHSDRYYIADSVRDISSVNDHVIFHAYRYYTASGRVVSGDTPLGIAEIRLDGRVVANNDGTFEVEGLYGDRTLSVSLRGYHFDDITIDRLHSNVVVNGTFVLNGVLNYDIRGIASVYVDDTLVDIVGDKFSYPQAHLGSILRVESEGYHTSSVIILSSTDDIVIDLYKQYDVDIDLGDADGVIATIDDETTEIVDGKINLSNMYGVHTLHLTRAGYHYDEVEISANNYQMTIVGEKLYTLSISVVSGEIVLDDAVVQIGGETFDVDSNGYYTIDNIYKPGSATISCDGYNPSMVNFDSENCTLVVDLSYDITGRVIVSGKGVAGVLVEIDNISTTTSRNGAFEISHLHGANTIRFSKDYYTIADVNVSESIGLTIGGMYTISGTLTNSLGGIGGMSVYLLNTETMDLISTTTNASGEYVITSLDGEYMLYYDEASNIALKPMCYDISAGGVFNFSDTGYGFSGRVTCGGMGVEDVMLVAGDARTYTDSNGYYKFDLIVSDAVLTLSKAGYVFEGNGLAVDGDYDERDDVDFSCTYSIQGRVMLGDVSMPGITISTQGKTTTTDENGYYSFDGLVGEGEIAIDADGYTFDGSKEYSGYCTRDFAMYYNQYIHVVSGELDVANVCVNVAGRSVYTDNSGVAILEHVTHGDVVTFEKENYIVSSITLLDKTDTIQVSASYTLSGVVTSIDPIPGVVVTYGVDSVVTDSMGRFEISGIEGSIDLSFSKSGFEFDNITIHGETSIVIAAKYSVSGYVKVGGFALAGVEVVAGSLSSTTDAQGYFVFAGLSTGINITFALSGYTFTPGSVYVASPETLYISAYYSISGRTMSGDIVVDGVKVSLSTGDYVYTDNDGRYAFNSVSDHVDITFEKSGYDTQTITNITGYRNDCNANMTYSVVVNFSGMTDYNGLTISVNGVSSSASGLTETITGLSGENTITFARTDYQFTPSSYIVSGHTEISVVARMVYTVSGTFKTTSGIAIPGATITAGTLSTTTDDNGAYTITGLNTSARVVATLTTTSDSITKETNVSSTCTYNFTVSDSDYAYFMWARGYDNLRMSRYNEIYGRGTVTPEKYAKAQSVSVMYKKDLNYKMFKNLNYGEEVNYLVIRVDPRIALLTVIDLSTNAFKYQTVSGSNVKSNLNADFTTSWQTDQTKASFLSNNGIDVDNFYPYTINKNTVRSITNLNKTTTGYTFTMTLDASKSETISNYKKQMHYMCSEQECTGFNSIVLKYAINNNGFITQMDIDESYNVQSHGMTVGTSAKISYYFYTTYMDKPITSAIDISSNTSIRATTALPSDLPSTTLSFIRPTDLYIYDERRYVL